MYQRARRTKAASAASQLPSQSAKVPGLRSRMEQRITGSSGAEADSSPLSLSAATPPASRAASTLCSVARARSSRRRGTACPHEIAAENLTRRLRGWQWLCGVRGACRAGCLPAAARLDPAPTQTPSETCRKWRTCQTEFRRAMMGMRSVRTAALDTPSCAAIVAANPSSPNSVKTSRTPTSMSTLCGTGTGTLCGSGSGSGCGSGCWVGVVLGSGSGSGLLFSRSAPAHKGRVHQREGTIENRRKSGVALRSSSSESRLRFCVTSHSNSHARSIEHVHPPSSAITVAAPEASTMHTFISLLPRPKFSEVLRRALAYAAA